MKGNVKNSKKILALALAGVAMLSISISSVVFFNKSNANKLDDEVVINILHTNDIHGDATNISYVAKYKQETENAILVDGGDATQGKSLATYTKGDALIQLMNASKYDLSTFGNHEYDYGLEQLMTNVENAEFPFVAANVVKKSGGLLLETEEDNGGYKIIEKAGKKIGFFGLSTVETAYKTNPENVKDLTIEPEIETAKKVVDELEEQDCDLIVALVHMGIDKESNPKSTDLAEQVDGIDLVIDGHSHSDLQYEAKNGAKVVQAGTQIKKLGHVKVTFNEENEPELESKLLTLDEFSQYGKDEEVEKLYKKLTDKVTEALATVIGKTDKDILANETTADGKVKRLVRNRETAIGDLSADSMEWEAKRYLEKTEYNKLPVVVLNNGGGLRDDLKAGDITVGQVLGVCPYGMYVSMKVVTPDVIYKALEHGISSLTLDENNEVSGYAGCYPQVAGMRFEMDMKKTPYKAGENDGERVLAVYLTNEDGTETLLDRNDKETQVVLASNNFIIAGGDGYTMLGDLKGIGDANTLDEALGDYITKLTEEGGGSFTYEMDGNRSVEINGKK